MFSSLLDVFDPDSVPVRLIIAMRDDYVFALNRWRRHLSALGQNTLELKALRGPEAYEAVFKPGELRCQVRECREEPDRTETGLAPIVDPRTAERIVRFVAQREGDAPLEEIEVVPPILSLLCRELNARRLVAGPNVNSAAPQIMFNEGDAQIETIVATFYERCLAPYPDAVRLFIEEDLVSHSGARVAQDERSILSTFESGYETRHGRAAGFGDARASRACLADLVAQRLLRPLIKID